MTRVRSRKEREELVGGRVTALDASGASGSRYSVTIAGRSGVVSAELVAEFSLRLGAELDDAQAEALTRAVWALGTFDLAVGLLASKARTARDLGVALRRRGALPHEVRGALERLVALGLLDDAAFAKQRARTKALGKGASKRRIQQDLARRGVAPATAKWAADSAAEEVGLDEHAAALEVARKKGKSFGRLEPAVARRRLYALLQRRGYSAAIAAQAVRTVLNELGTGE